jgi:hypothetical protein
MTSPDRHVTAEIGAYIDATLPASDSDRVRVHLGECLDCRRVHDALRDGLAAIGQLPTYALPANVWSGIEQELDRKGIGVSGLQRDVETRDARSGASVELVPRAPWWSYRVAAAVLVVAGGVLASSVALGVYHSSWSIERVAGAPVAGTRTIVRGGTLAEGEWLETDAASRARLSIGTLGTADIGPGSRVRLVQAGGVERSLHVERGSIDARVWAPPRFFLVETPAATAVDLGCIYSLDVDEQGNGVLRVRSGQVELRGHGRGSLVVAGTIAEMRRGEGPGTPYVAGEPEAFRNALAVVDFAGGRGDRRAALEQVLSTATAGSTITLWHLLPRVTPEERVLVYDRLASVAAPPPGVERDDVLALDAQALSRWRTTLEPTWSSERVRLWKRAWRAVWSAARAE